VTDKLAKRRQRRLGVAAVFLLLLVAILAAPFLLSTRLVNLALEQVFPANRLSVGSATLSLSGTLVLRDLLLHDTGPLAGANAQLAEHERASHSETPLLWNGHLAPWTITVIGKKIGSLRPRERGRSRWGMNG
jgi:hypothetical protein